ncbi:MULTISPECIES: GNAT family N-acetyltransferase [Actinoplanes]|uniref:GNAT family N-acetyltransferase n=1 Tax=Actinoplanes TaxID=1865 RepID=UPI0005F2C5AE|nr:MULTISPECIES: GNAT family N-acetyltransferase [Actinoplanes]GLY01330.1 N-acetyltransferase [Actinoplanes sp. NBRC 101535]
MTITTRHGVIGDDQLLRDLAARTFGLACPPGTAQSDIDEFLAAHLSADNFAHYLADPNRIILLVSDSDQVVGYSMLVLGPIADPDVTAVIDEATSVELSKFYVAEESHGSGAASVLMAETLDVASKIGARSCWLGVNQQNERAARFYTKHDFAIVGTKRFLVGSDWHDDHIRRRELGA